MKYPIHQLRDMDAWQRDEGRPLQAMDCCLDGSSRCPAGLFCLNKYFFGGCPYIGSGAHKTNDATAPGRHHIALDLGARNVPSVAEEQGTKP
jgi:hypothetical protein